MHQLRGVAPEPVPAMLMVLFVLLSASRVSPARGEMPMQLSRAELVRLAGYGEEKLSSVLVMGTVLCDACPQPGSESHTSHVSGASVAVACKTGGNRRRTNWAFGTTDEYGEFIVDLPSHLHAIPKLDEACFVRLLHLPRNSQCRRVSRVHSRRIKLSSVGNSIRVYTAGNLRLGRQTKASHECLRRRNGGLGSTK